MRGAKKKKKTPTKMDAKQATKTAVPPTNGVVVAGRYREWGEELYVSNDNGACGWWENNFRHWHVSGKQLAEHDARHD